MSVGTCLRDYSTIVTEVRDKRDTIRERRMVGAISLWTVVAAAAGQNVILTFSSVLNFWVLLPGNGP